MKTALRALSILLVLTAMFAFSDESFGLGRCRGRRCRPADPTPDPVVTAEPKPEPQPQPDPVTPKPDIYTVPSPDLSGCDSRGHTQARQRFAEKVGAGMGEILADMKKETATAIFSCKLMPVSFRKNCCKGTRDAAAKECKRRVREKADNDAECKLTMPDCRIILPRCIRDRITEKKRAQCCSYLKPQATEALLSFCDKAADQTTESCDVPATETPEPTWTPFDLFATPTTPPRQPTATPTDVPTVTPTFTPTDVPTGVPTVTPTSIPTDTPNPQPTSPPTKIPTKVPSAVPTEVPSYEPTDRPTAVPTDTPTATPTDTPVPPYATSTPTYSALEA